MYDFSLNVNTIIDKPIAYQFLEYKWKHKWEKQNKYNLSYILSLNQSYYFLLCIIGLICVFFYLSFYRYFFFLMNCR